MPFYDYSCSKCKNIQEEFHAMSGSNRTIKCDNCGSVEMIKIINAPYSIFKGSGWCTNEDRGIEK